MSDKPPSPPQHDADAPDTSAAPSPKMPARDAHPYLWALFYYELGWWPLPIRDAEDLVGYHAHLVKVETKRGKTAAEAQTIADSRVNSRAARRSTMIPWRKMKTPPTLAQVTSWWRERPDRGIILLTGPGRGISAIDVDTDKGGDGEPWAGTTPAIAESPSGGYHYVYREADIRSTVCELAEGIDTRGAGGLIAAPAGSASPGRHWRSWGEPAEFPPESAARLAARAPRTSGAEAPTYGAPEREDELAGLTVRPSQEDRSFAAAILEPARDGERHRKAAAIVGLLARRRPLPHDAVDAALGLLRDHATREQYRAGFLTCIERAWRESLRASERSGEFCLEVLSAWNSTRGHPPWDTWKVQETARGLWRTASGREEEQALTVAAEDVNEDLDQLLPSLAATYTQADFDADCKRGLLSVGTLPPWADYKGEIDPAVSTGHGWGPILDDALGGGIAPGYFLVIGAEQAKGGKSAFIEQLRDGLALHSAAVLAGKKSGPVVVPYNLSEMWQGGEAGSKAPPNRQILRRALARWLGVDSNIFRRGMANAGEAPGIRRLAEQLDVDPQELAIAALSEGRRCLESGPFHAASKITTPINVRWLSSAHDKEESDQAPTDHRRGVPLLRQLALAINLDRERKAKAWGIPEEDVWPLLFIDPIQRFQGGGDNAVGSLDEFVEELRALADEHGFIIFATSDTNQAAARGQTPKKSTTAQRAAAAYRGSYKLLHLPDSALVISIEWPNTKDRGQPAHARVWVALNRWGAPMSEPAHYHFIPESGRFIPLAGPPVDTTEFEEDDEPDELSVPAQPRTKKGRFGEK